MLLAGWKVRIVKNCDRGLQNAARGAQAEGRILKPEVTAFHYTDRPFLAVNWLTIWFVYVTLSLNWFTRRLQTFREKSNERTSESDTRQRKMY